jgi:hypothetical protein
MSNKLTLVWNRKMEHTIEVDWIEDLFREIPHDVVENTEDHSLFYDNSVVIDTVRWAPHHNEYINKLIEKGYKFGICDLADESYNSPTDTYKHAMFVIRQYHKDNLPDHVLHIPCGYNKGFNSINDNPVASDRTHTWAFIGNRMDATRKKMKTTLSTVDNGYFYSGTDTGQMISPVEMSKIYRNTKFIPCPHGWFNLDSFRVTEALEAGAIPIVDASDYWQKLYGEIPPFIQITDWNDSASVVNSLLSKPEELEQLRVKCYNWWMENKQQLTSSVSELSQQMLDHVL